MNCPSCESPVPDGARFCPGCGAELATALRRDRLERLIPRQYLDQLAATRGRPAGERRVVTILFCDVKGSTAMAETLDPEDVMEIMNGAFETLIAPIYRYEGTLARLMGDAVLAFFGAPIAHEDDAVRACRAAVDLLGNAREYAARLERERGIPGFDVRVGINTGLVVVGEVGADLRVEYTAMGDAVNLAARVESAAAPGTALITGETQRLVEDTIETESLGPVTVKGRAQPVELYRIVGTRTGATARSPEGTFVGRERELETLRLAVAAAAAGAGVSVAVRGQAGMGKSRLVSRVRAVSPPGVSWVEARCASYGREISYWSAGELLHGLLGTTLSDHESRVSAALETAVPGITPLHRGDLLHVLGFHRDDGAGTAERRSRIVDTFTGLVEHAALTAPRVLVWEDCQWIDECSAEILAGLRDVCARAPLVVFALIRDDEAGAMQDDGFDVTVDLRPLGRAESEVLAAGLAGDQPLPPSLLSEVIDAARGNPFFLEQVLGSLLDVSEMVDSGWSVRNLTVPTTLHGAVMSRIDGLHPREKQTLQAAAVTGRVFSGDVLADVRGDEWEASIAELRRRGFIHGADAPDEYAFRQPMTAEVAYDSLLKSQRVDLHRRTGEAIERLYPEQRLELAPVLAHHYEAAGVPAKAFVYLVHAARRAAMVSANREALRRFRRALALVDAPGVDVEASSVVPDRAALHEEAGDVCVVLGYYEDARSFYDTAADLAGSEAARLRVRRKTAGMLLRWRRHDEARVLFESLLAAETKSLDRAEVAHIYSGLGMTRYHDGDLDAALELETKALEIMTELDDGRGIAQAHNNAGVILARRGDHAAAVEANRRAVSRWEVLGDDYGLAIAWNNLGLALHGRGGLDEAADAFERAVALFEKVGNRHGLACACDNLGQVYSERGETDAAHECLKRAVSIMAEISVDRDEIRPEMWYTGAM